MKKFETHLHNAENSGCASAPARDIPKVYHDQGYEGIFVTNHYNIFAFDFLSEGKKLTWHALMDRYLFGFRTIKEEGEKIGMKVLLGVELSPHRYISAWGGDYPGMEFLMYGLTEQFLYQNPNLHLLSQQQLFETAEKNGLLMYQAHPFRVYCVQGDPCFMHGAETYNHLNEKYGKEPNDEAVRFASDHNLLQIAGSDFHHLSSVRTGLSGVYLPDTINTPQDFVKYAKQNPLKQIK